MNIIFQDNDPPYDNRDKVESFYFGLLKIIRIIITIYLHVFNPLKVKKKNYFLTHVLSRKIKINLNKTNVEK